MPVKVIERETGAEVELPDVIVLETDPVAPTIQAFHRTPRCRHVREASRWHWVPFLDALRFQAGRPPWLDEEESPPPEPGEPLKPCSHCWGYEFGGRMGGAVTWWQDDLDNAVTIYVRCLPAIQAYIARSKRP